MTPSEREFGELRSDVRNVARSVGELGRTNSAEHAANAARFDRLADFVQKALDGKADKDWVKSIDEDVDGLKTSRDRFDGARLLLWGSASAVIGAVGYFIHS